MSKDEEKEQRILDEQQDRRSQRTERPGIKSGDRQAWTQGLDSGERQRPGMQLIDWLINEANNQGVTLAGLAQRLRITYGYLRQLRNGDREVKRISDEFAEAAAEFLDVPRLSVLMAAGVVRPEDFRYTESFEHELERALRYVSRDPVYGALCPATIWTADRAIQQYVVTLYEAATGKTVLGEKVDLEALTQSFAGDGSGNGEADETP